MLNSAIDDVRIYNYALTADEVAALYDGTDGIKNVEQQRMSDVTTGQTQATKAFDLSGRRANTNGVDNTLPRGLYIINGRKVVVK